MCVPWSRSLQRTSAGSAPLRCEHLRPPANTQVERRRIYNGFVLINCYNDFWCYILMLLWAALYTFPGTSQRYISESTALNLIIIKVIISSVPRLLLLSTLSLHFFSLLTPKRTKLVGLSPWLSILNTNSINLNINASKTQTVSINKPAAPVLIKWQKCWKARGAAPGPSLNRSPVSRIRGWQCFYWHFFKTSYFTLTLHIYHLTLLSGGRGDGGGKAGKPAGDSERLWATPWMFFFFFFKDTLFGIFAESKTYIFDVRLAHFHSCLWSQIRYFEPKIRQDLNLKKCFGSWTQPEQESQCFEK